MKNIILVALLIIMPKIILANFNSNISIGYTIIQGNQGLKHPYAIKGEFGYHYKGIVLYTRGEYWGGYYKPENSHRLNKFSHYCYSFNISVFLYKGLFIGFGKGEFFQFHNNILNFDGKPKQRVFGSFLIGYQEPIDEHLSLKFEVYQNVTELFDEFNHVNLRIGVNYEF